jgi:hypothetical protein
MNIFSKLSLVVSLVLFSVAGSSAEMARARMWCLSLRFQQGTAGFGETLDLSTINSSQNGELAPTFSGRTYVSLMTLDVGFAFTGLMNVDLPPFADSNGDGFDDFFDVTQGVQATTAGSYQTDVSMGTITASWSRGAGSKDGTCVFALHDNTFGDLGNFRHNFEVLEYIGQVAYTPGSNSVAGAVSLTQTGIPDNQIGGQVQFVKAVTNRFNLLSLQPGTWTNSAAQALVYLADDYKREAAWPTNYYGFFDFQDGNLSTGDLDYTTWFLSIDDLNDVNHNGIPDFSDDPQTISPPRPPRLSLIAGSGGLTLTIAGDIGHTHQVQEVTSLNSTNWQPVISVTLTNDPQQVPLPLPTEATHFWRVVAQ